MVLGMSKWNREHILFWKLREKRCIIRLVLYDSTWNQNFKSKYTCGSPETC